MLTKDDVLVVSKHPDLGRLVDDWLEQHNARVPIDGIDGIRFASCKRRDRIFRGDIADKIVVGCLPLHLAAYTAAIIEPVLRVPSELRGQVLTFDQLKACCDGIQLLKIDHQRIA